ncbi:hypothetical protein [Collimonas pratensis]|uniref:Putative lipoprotein n=1 Tax=Collimonas pratensis TaxID=279113 RepID=A0A127Q141_9BURK|nr:hypothetical protein [Collimonas pratensis]AMP03743.1 putative lipoprotein [Collimonas pratensis]
MKNIVVGVALVLAISGCAMDSSYKFAKLKKKHEAEIQSITGVEIFYSPEQMIVMQTANNTSSDVIAVGSLLGPVGTLAAGVGGIALQRKAASDVVTRTEEFSQAVHEAATQQDMHLAFANKLKSAIESTGRVVKLTEIKRPPEKKLGMRPAKGQLPSFTVSEGYSPLLLRMTVAYGAADLLNDYHPVLVTEYVLMNQKGNRVLLGNTYTSVPAKPAYASYPELLKDALGARQSAKDILISTWPDQISNSVFGVSAAVVSSH